MLVALRQRYDIPPAVPFRATILKEVTAVPRPLNSTAIWQSVTSGKPRGLQHMAKHGIKGMPRTDGGEPPRVSAESLELTELYRQAAIQGGRDIAVGEELGVYMMCNLGEDRVSAVNEVEIYEQESFKGIQDVGGGPSDAMLKEVMWKTSRSKGFTLDQLTHLGGSATAAEAAAEMGYVSLEDRAAADAANLFGHGRRDHRDSQGVGAHVPGDGDRDPAPAGGDSSARHYGADERFALEVMPAFPGSNHAGRTFEDRCPLGSYAREHPTYRRSAHATV